MDPKTKHAYVDRGISYLWKGQYDLAIRDFNAAVQVDPDDAYAYLNRGTAYRRDEQPHKAIQDFNKVIALDGKLQDAYYRRGVFRLDNGKYEEAIPDFRKAVELDPKDAFAQLRLFLARERLGRDGKAGLRAGDFRTAGRRSWSHGEPFHVWMLIELDYVAVPQLLGALRDDTPTRADYMGRFGWTGGAVFGDAPVRIATIGDIADYVLRQIYSTDVGYASYLSKKDREIAIQRWRKMFYRGIPSENSIGP